MKLICVIIGALLIVAADALIKKVSAPGAQHVLAWWLVIVGLYGLQCYLAYWVFGTGNAPLGVFACLFVVFYTIFGCVAGYVWFDESFTWTQRIGVCLALTGAVLLSKESGDGKVDRHNQGTETVRQVDADSLD